MGASNNLSRRPIRLGKPPVGLVPWQQWIVTALEKVARSCGIAVQIDGAQSATEGAGGELAFKVNPGSTETHAWKASAVDSTHISLSGGTITDEVATFTPDLSSIVVDDTELNYVYLHLEITPTITSGFCSLAGITAATVEAFTTEQTNSNTDWYILLFEWQTGNVTAQHCYFSMQCEGGYGGDGVASIKSWPLG